MKTNTKTIKTLETASHKSRSIVWGMPNVGKSCVKIPKRTSIIIRPTANQNHTLADNKKVNALLSAPGASTKKKAIIRTTPTALRKLTKRMFAAKLPFEKVTGVRPTMRKLGFDNAAKFAVWLMRQGY